MRDKYQVTEEPCELKGSSTVLESSGSCERIADFTRSCHDAIEAIYLSINKKPKFVLDADIAKCFDRIDHEALLTKLNTSPTIRRQIRAWLKARVMDGEQLFPTSEGTPQGGGITPFTMLQKIFTRIWSRRIGSDSEHDIHLSLLNFNLFN